MKIKDLQHIKDWVYLQIEQWAEDNYNSAVDWACSSKEAEKIKKDIDLFKKKKKEEFDSLFIRKINNE